MTELELYKAHTWENKDVNGNVTSGAPALSALNLQKMDSGIQINREYLINLIDDVENLKNSLGNFVKVCDYNNLLAEIKTSERWEAPSDCWLIGALTSRSGKLYVNNQLVSFTSAVSSFDFSYSLFLKKGSTVHFDSGSAKAFGCLGS